MVYRLYFLDASEKISGIMTFDSSNDDSAILVAESRAAGRFFEVWNRDRLVIRNANPNVSVRL